MTVKIGTKNLLSAPGKVLPLDQYGTHVAGSVSRHPPQPGVILGTVSLAQ